MGQHDQRFPFLALPDALDVIIIVVTEWLLADLTDVM